MNNRGSGFSSLHPGLCFSYFVMLVLFSMIFRHPAYLVGILACAAGTNVLLDGGKALKKNLRVYLVMAAVILLLNPIFSQRGATILFYFRDRPVTLESAAYGGLFALSLLSILVAFLAYNRVVTPDRFLYLFSSILPRAAFIVTVALRFIPLMKRRLQEITAVRQALGAVGGKTKKQKARESMEMLNILVTWSLESSMQMAVSMRARGYGTGRRSSAAVYRMEKRDAFWLGFMALTGGSALLGGVLGYGLFEVYPRLGNVSPVFTWHFAAVLLFLSVPLYLEGRELIRWRFIRSKM